MDEPDPIDELTVLATLGEPNRRALYDYVASAGSWVGRDEAAVAIGLQRGVAAHHLDRLADDGLLEVDYRRLTGRSGPGAGRPAKVYRRARRELGVSLPPRDYELAGRLLADAVAASLATGTDVSAAVAAAAAAAGRELGRGVEGGLGARPRPDEVRDAFIAALTEQGFEPVGHPDGTVTLRNCPFHLLARRHAELICGMNHTLIEAALDELPSPGLVAVLQPDPDSCCVRLTRSPAP